MSQAPKEAEKIKMPMRGVDRTNEIREDLVRKLAEEVLTLRDENLALKREVEELKKRR